MKQAGIDRQIEAVMAACSSADFTQRFGDAVAIAGDSIVSMRDVQRVVHGILDEMAVAHRGVFLTFSWDPSTRKLGIYFRPQRPLAQVARSALKSVEAVPA